MNNDKYFSSVFDDWADKYDDTINSHNGEYAEVFLNYDLIIKSVVDKISHMHDKCVIDIGAGTGNLTFEVHKRGYNVIGIEPNMSMRKIAAEKHPDIAFSNGDFLNLPDKKISIGSIVSSYAFHHITDVQKAKAARYYAKQISKEDKVIIADTFYETEAVKNEIIKDAQGKEYKNLYKDLNTEYYTTHDKVRSFFESAGFVVSFEKMNKFVWIMEATKI